MKMRVYIPEQKNDPNLMTDIINFMYDNPSINLISINKNHGAKLSLNTLTNKVEVFSYVFQELNKGYQVILNAEK